MLIFDMMKIKFQPQLDENDCGPACLKMVADYYGATHTLHNIRTLCHTDTAGTSLLQLQKACIAMNLQAYPVQLPFERKTAVKDEINDLNDVPLPAILHWKENHYVVLTAITEKAVTIVDPAIGRVNIAKEEFRPFWINKDTQKGYALIFEYPVPGSQKSGKAIHLPILGFLKKHLLLQRKTFSIVFILVFSSILLGLLTPAITKGIIDNGFTRKGEHYIIIALIGQLLIYLGSSITHIYEIKLATRLSQNLNATLVYDYLKKILRLPLSLFDNYKTADFLMRTYDFARIDSFISYNAISLFIALLLLVAFTVVLLSFSYRIFLVFLLFQLINVWVSAFFLRKRKKHNLLRYQFQSDSFSTMIEIIEGLRDIRLSGSEQFHLHRWKESMHAYYANNTSDVNIAQKQSAFSGLLANIFNLTITLYTSFLLTNNGITLGEMVTIQFVIGQLNSSASSITNSFSILQDLKISFERIRGINELQEEGDGHEKLAATDKPFSLYLRNLYFNYSGTGKETAQLKDINLTIEGGKTTAIVGSSGSGKTTLLKLLLGFYPPTAGEILLGTQNISGINLSSFREKCGVVMQDGYIFNDTVINNVTLAEKADINFSRYLKAIEGAKLSDFIISLPQEHNTMIGNGGLSLSNGQRQRIFIARMIYRQPMFVILDEATNALDAITEHLVLTNLNEAFNHTTRIIVAHRLYAIKNADHIIVLDKGIVAEEGTHQSLLSLEGLYYQMYLKQKSSW